jgi:hypothetical protein
LSVTADVDTKGGQDDSKRVKENNQHAEGNQQSTVTELNRG